MLAAKDKSLSLYKKLKLQKTAVDVKKSIFE